MRGVGEAKVFKQQFSAMGSPCEMQFDGIAPADAERLAAQIVADVRRLEVRYSRYQPDSLLSRINRVAASGGSIAVDGETAALLDYAQACHAESDGLFDITSGLLRQVWPLHRTTLPTPGEVAALLPRIGWDKVTWAAPQLSFGVAGMALDFGGIVKEYAVDRAASLAAQAGVGHGFINLGGDLRVIGPQADGQPWQIGIRHPRQPDGLLTTLALSSGAVASSGDYERCLLIDGIRYGHILNPRSGWPVQTLAAVTVCAPLCVVAGSAATIAMLKEGDGPAWLAAMGAAALWVSVKGDIGGELAGGT